jgi:hypothetical protein
VVAELSPGTISFGRDLIQGTIHRMMKTMLGLTVGKQHNEEDLYTYTHITQTCTKTILTPNHET